MPKQKNRVKVLADSIQDLKECSGCATYCECLVGSTKADEAMMPNLEIKLDTEKGIVYILCHDFVDIPTGDNDENAG